MARDNNVWSRRRDDIPFSVCLLAKRPVESVHHPSVIIVGVPASAVRVIVGAIVGIVVIPITAGESPPRFDHHLSRSCLRNQLLTSDHSQGQAKANHYRERLFTHDRYFLTKVFVPTR